METPTIDELEESLRKLKVQVDSLASSLSFRSDEDDILNREPSGDSSPLSCPEAPSGSYGEFTTGGSPEPPAESERFLKPKGLLRSLGDYSALTHLGLPTFTLSSADRVAGMLGSEMGTRNSVPSMDLAFPLKLGAPHVIGVRSLLPPKIPVRSCSPERCPPSPDRGRSLSLGRSEAGRSQSFSPVSKRSRRLRSRSQSPRPVWRPNSAKANACAQPPPQLGKPRGSRKKNGSGRQSRWRIYRPGSLAARSDAPSQATGRGAPNDPWSPYSLPSAAISSPTAQELNERFLRTLAEGATGGSPIERSPYQKELAHLRLERLRAEEAWLLELRRQQELERTRGPKPKWQVHGLEPWGGVMGTQCLKARTRGDEVQAEKVVVGLLYSTTATAGGQRVVLQPLFPQGLGGERELDRVPFGPVTLDWFPFPEQICDSSKTEIPVTSWDEKYEIKNAQFHYEARKNNELLKNGPDVQLVGRYREELATASEEFQRHPRSTHPEVL
ncbi:UNVERIFIED_CONTAM: hypothetical protein K2H54_010787 [Gekko kuhli]